MLCLCYYITGHGLGHATRAVGIIQSLLNLGHQISIISALQEDFFYANLQHTSSNLICYNRALDSGAIQTDPITVDPIATLETCYQNIFLRREEIINRELEFLKLNIFHAIITDATPIICYIGQIVGLPVILITNFTWDFIYAEMLAGINSFLAAEKRIEYENMVKSISNDYSSADLFIRLPMETPLSEYYQINMHKVYTSPLLCRHSVIAKNELRSKHNIPNNKKILVLCFGGHKNSRCQKFLDYFLPDDWICLVFGMDSSEFKNTTKFVSVPFDSYVPDYINLADVVLGKIGYGTVTECLAHGTPLIYVPRSSWPEEQYGIDYLDSLNAGVILSPTDFYDGNWTLAIELAYSKIGSWDCNSLGAASAIPEISKKIEDFVAFSNKSC